MGAKTGHPNYFKGTHKMSHTKTYNTWSNLIGRCKGRNKLSKKNYKDKGITYDPRWNNFSNFIADMGVQPEGLEIDRVDNTLGYYKENCRWVSHSHNNANKVFKKRNLPRGVNPQEKGFRASISINNKSIHLGSFHTIKEAEQAYLSAYKKIHGELPPEYRTKDNNEVKDNA